MPLTLPASLSPSKVASFTSCGLAFRFSVIDRLPEAPSVAAARGTVVHRALELLYCLAPAERTLDAALASLADSGTEVLATAEYADLALEDPGAFMVEAEQLVRRYFELED
nr:PD-(D/E)XK nuclease family protein [Acidimicrobiia bacterium]